MGARPKGTLRLSTPTHGDESIRVPLAVAKRVKSLQKSGELAPSSRAELLYHVGIVSEACARERVEGLIDRRDYSSKELFDKLRADGYTQDLCTRLVSRAKEVGIVSDERFADVFIRTKIGAGWGRQRIERELSRRGIDPVEVSGWPHEYLDEESEFERAYQMASRRRLTGKNDYAKLVRFLASRGFAIGLATSVSRQVLDEATGED